jgi:hypothetical protein
LGAPIVFNKMPMAVDTYGWYIVEGLLPVFSYATVAANAIAAVSSTAGRGIIASGGGHLRIQGLAVLAAPTTTVTGTIISGDSGAYTIRLQDNRGFFKGLFLTGTAGVGTSALITDVYPDHQTVGVSVANSAACSGTLTGTFQGTSNVFWTKCRAMNPVGAWAVS